MQNPTPDSVYTDLLGQIEKDCIILFLGAGSTAVCKSNEGKRGLTGPQLAAELLKTLNGGTDPGLDKPSLTEASEYFVANHPGRRQALDTYLTERLSPLQPTIGHRIAATFPWTAVITTNYNRVVENAWGEASSHGYAARDIFAIRKDEDLKDYKDDRGNVPLLKPHGCISVQQQPKHKMVITSRDYFESEDLRKGMYARIEELARNNTTLFVGYSLNDYTFRNIYFRLFSNLGEYKMRSYCVGLVGNPTQFRWMSTTFNENFNTTLIDDTFDTFMLRLAKARGTLHGHVRAEVSDRWPEVQADASLPWKNYLAGVKKSEITSLRD